MATPEGKTKKLINELLAAYDVRKASDAGGFESAAGWYYMPIKGASFGVSGIPDYIGQYRGYFFGIEAKALGKTPTGFQALQIGAIQCSGGACFVVDGAETLKKFEGWLKERK